MYKSDQGLALFTVGFALLYLGNIHYAHCWHGIEISGAGKDPNKHHQNHWGDMKHGRGIVPSLLEKRGALRSQQAASHGMCSQGWPPSALQMEPLLVSDYTHQTSGDICIDLSSLITVRKAWLNVSCPSWVSRAWMPQAGSEPWTTVLQLSL